MGKKELFLKLDNKKPKYTEQDEKLKQLAGQSLARVIDKFLTEWFAWLYKKCFLYIIDWWWG